MKALALFGLLFVSSLGFAQMQRPVKFRNECQISHHLDASINSGTWIGDCGKGLAEGYGRFNYYVKGKDANAPHDTFRKYKDGRAANPYFIESDDVRGNQLFKENPDGSIKLLSDCGKVPDSSCAAIVNYTYSRKYLTYIVDRQKIKGSYPGPQNYPGVTPNVATSGGYTPALAIFMRGFVGKKVACTTEAINAVSSHLLEKSKSETDPCERSRYAGRHIYFVLTTMELSCPNGQSIDSDDWKDQFHVYAVQALRNVRKVCGAEASVNDLPEGKVTPPPAHFLDGVTGYKVACDGGVLTAAITNTDQANFHETQYCYREKEIAKYRYVALTTFERSCPKGASAAADSVTASFKRDFETAVQTAIQACSQPY